MPDTRREKLTWMLHRLRAMSAGEVLGHARRRWYAATEFPPAHRSLRSPKTGLNLRGDSRAAIFQGKWRVFYAIELDVDDPPLWQKDYLAGRDLFTLESSFRLNHRALPAGCDIKLIWEINRWTHLVALASAGEEERVVRFLEDWAEKNPPYRGWNWTSALESGIRLVNFYRIDAHLRPKYSGRMDELAALLLPAHARFTWRYRSFGSSANNHLIGELAGLILSIVHWPELARDAAPLSKLQLMWEREVLAQFAGDGGNREQALHYHWFSLALCVLVRDALTSVSPAVIERLARAEEFYSNMRVEGESWDYGDSDDAELTALLKSPAPATKWRFFEESGYAMYRSRDWMLRWDLSPLGYLSTAAHGHLDALHLSVWHDGHAVIIDPGTGAYFADARLRDELSRWSAHNGPCPVDTATPRRLGPFLWSHHHAKPLLEKEILLARLGRVERQIKLLEAGRGVTVEDTCDDSFEVNWQFAPGATVKQVGPRAFQLDGIGLSLNIICSDGWANAQLQKKVCSPSFRRVTESPALQLTGRGTCSTRFELK